MTRDEIKTAIEQGKPVFWENELYDVKLWKDGKLYVVCNANQYATGLQDEDLDATYIEED